MTTPATDSARLAVLLSGSGRTLQNLLEAINRGEVRAQVVLVIASKECRGAERARAAGIHTLVLPGVLSAQTLEHTLAQHRIDVVVCAGYLKYVHVPAAYRHRIINIHPSLLPAFGGQGMYGDRVHTAALDAFRRGEIRESGCTVHLVDEIYDHGRILLQRRVPILNADDVHSLAARVFEAECRALPEALATFLSTLADGKAG